jgi:uncharacterized protein YcnI
LRSFTLRLAVSFLVTLGALAVPSGTASAHVTVEPRESTTRAFQRYTVRLPTEKDVPTIKIRVEFPAGVVVSRFLPKAGWTRDTEKDGTGRLVAVTWSGGQIAPDEFEEFGFIGRNPAEAGAISWKAYQTYQDGETVEWSGPEGSDKPASVTIIRAATVAEGGGVEAPGEARVTAGSKPSAGAETRPASPAATSGSDLPLFAGLVAVVLSVIALVLSGVALARRSPANQG